MATIAVYSIKGGVGKTTIAANLAWCSAATSKRSTLLWDLDAAGGGGFLFGIEPTRKQRAASVFAQDADPAELVQATTFPNLGVLPADASLRALDAALLKLGKRPTRPAPPCARWPSAGATSPTPNSTRPSGRRR